MWFDTYWRILGLPLSRLKGVVTDAIPFSLVETTLWVGSAATVLFLATFAPTLFHRVFRHLAKPERKASKPRDGLIRNVRISSLLLGPVLLLALGLGQGAFPGSLAPSAWRSPLTARLGVDSLSHEDFRAWVAHREARLMNTLKDTIYEAEPPLKAGESHWKIFQELTETDVLLACDTSLDAVLEDLGLLAGRHVRTFKNMGPVTTTIGLAYGGPAFHDPFFGEIAIVRDADMPAPHYWRLTAACHEAAHAKGFTREIDAEILTQLALLRIENPAFQILADIHFLRKTGLVISWPDSLIAEGQAVRVRRRRVEADQHVVRILRRIAQRFGVQNSGTKYGVRGPQDDWNPKHPFFATVKSHSTEVATEVVNGRK